MKVTFTITVTPSETSIASLVTSIASLDRIVMMPRQFNALWEIQKIKCYGLASHQIAKVNNKYKKVHTCTIELQASVAVEIGLRFPFHLSQRLI